MNNWVRSGFILLVCLVSLLVVILQSPAVAQESSTFVMERISVAVGATKSTSASFENTAVVAQESPSGANSFCNTGFVNSLGYWSVLGDLPVPIRLTVGINELDPGSLDLSWTGVDDVFQVYRAFTPEDILNPANLYQETMVCAAMDNNAFQSDIIFYKVVPRP